MATPVDILDVAYIPLGAKQALIDAADDVGDSGADGGEWEYVEACIDHAPLLDQVWREVVGTFPGVWCYEVAEPRVRLWTTHPPGRQRFRGRADPAHHRDRQSRLRNGVTVPTHAMATRPAHRPGFSFLEEP